MNRPQNAPEPRQDLITDSVVINAPRERVWELVSRPGWWLGDEDPPVHEVVTQGGDSTMLKHPEHGQFTIVTRGMDELQRATFLWAAGEPDDKGDIGKTVVEFWLADTADGTEVTVEETGFYALSIDDEQHARSIAANTEGWASQLALLKARAERE